MAILPQRFLQFYLSMQLRTAELSLVGAIGPSVEALYNQLKHFTLARKLRAVQGLNKTPKDLYNDDLDLCSILMYKLYIHGLYHVAPKSVFPTLHDILIYRLISRKRWILHFQKNKAERDPNMLILHDCLGRMSHQAKNMSNGRWGGPLVSRVP